MPAKVDGPMASNCVPEPDDTPELDDEDATLFWEFIGILRWSTLRTQQQEELETRNKIFV